MSQVVEVAGFPITPDVRLVKREEFEGISFEVTNSRRHGFDWNTGAMEETGGIWCYCVTVSEAQLQPDLFAEFWLDGRAVEHKSGFPSIHYDYYVTKFSSVEWHGGVTYYEKLGGLDGAQRYVKIGCDFAHSWDDGIDFDYEQVKREAIETVKQLQEVYPFRRRCPYYGTYHDAAEMISHPKSGALYSVAGIEAMTKESQSA